VWLVVAGRQVAPAAGAGNNENRVWSGGAGTIVGAGRFWPKTQDHHRVVSWPGFGFSSDHGSRLSTDFDVFAMPPARPVRYEIVVGKHILPRSVQLVLEVSESIHATGLVHEFAVESVGDVEVVDRQGIIGGLKHHLQAADGVLRTALRQKGIANNRQHEGACRPASRLGPARRGEGQQDGGQGGEEGWADACPRTCPVRLWPAVAILASKPDVVITSFQNPVQKSICPGSHQNDGSWTGKRCVWQRSFFGNTAGVLSPIPVI